MVFENERVGRLPQVPEEALGRVEVPDRTSGDRGEERKEVIAAPLTELLAEGAGPVLGPHLPAVDVEGRPAGLAVGPARADLPEKRPDEGVIMGVKGGRV